MTPRRKREQIKLKILEAERMLSQVTDHPLMSLSFQKRIEELQKDLETISADTKEPTVTLLFSGGPVLGSVGIDASFLGKVLLPFQKMVQSDLVQRGYGKVGARGQIKNADEARLFVTALPRGSFGVELSKLEFNNLFDENQVSDSLVQISKLIDSSAKSDEEFVASLDTVSSRTLNELSQFLKVIADDKAGVTIESGNIKTSLSNEEVQQAYKRVSETTTKETEVEIKGVLKGILLESWKFDFLSDTEEAITGSLNPGLSESEATEAFVKFFNKTCIAVMQKTSVFLKSGRVKDSYVLMQLNAT